MRKSLILFLTMLLMFSSCVPVLADDWQVVGQVAENGSRVSITVGVEDADPDLMFAISDPVAFHSSISFGFSWNELRPLVSKDRGKTWRQIMWPPKPTSADEFKFIPYFYKGILRADLNEYELYFEDNACSTRDLKCRLVKVSTYETVDGSSWSMVDEPKKEAPYTLHLTQGELMAQLVKNVMETRIAINVKDYYAADEQTVLYIKDDGTLYRAGFNGAKAQINAVRASFFVDSEPLNPVEFGLPDSHRSKPSDSGTRTIAAVNCRNSEPLAIIVSQDNGCTWDNINCELPGKVFGSEQKIKILPRKDWVCITDLNTTAMFTNNHGISWKTIELPGLTAPDFGNSIQFINNSDTMIIFYNTRKDTYRYEYKLEQMTDGKPAS